MPLVRIAPTVRPSFIPLFAVFAALALASCAPLPPRPERQAREPAAESAPANTRPATNVYAYPLNGQSEEQQDRDRYECYLWAVKQTGFDPSAPNLPPQQRIRVVSDPSPGTAVATDAVAGAVIGAAVAGPRDSGEGALVGAAAGAIIGAASEAQRTETRETTRPKRSAAMEQQASEYRRAVSACLEGRSYRVG